MKITLGDLYEKSSNKDQDKKTTNTVKWYGVFFIVIGIFLLLFSNSLILKVFGIISSGVGIYLLSTSKKTQYTYSNDDQILNSDKSEIDKTEETYQFYWTKVVGVTFDNSNGRNRQPILRKLYFKDAPFDKEINITLSQYEYEGKPAIGVYANGEQIGNIAKDTVSKIIDFWNKIDKISSYDISGGGHGQDGNSLSFGIEICIRLFR